MSKTNRVHERSRSINPINSKSEKLIKTTLDAAIDSLLDSCANNSESGTKMNSCSKTKPQDSRRKKGFMFLRRSPRSDSANKNTLKASAKEVYKIKNGTIRDYIDNKLKKSSNIDLRNSPSKNGRRRRRSTSLTKFLRRRRSFDENNNRSPKNVETQSVRVSKGTEKSDSLDLYQISSDEMTKNVEDEVRKHSHEESNRKMRSTPKIIRSPNLAKVDALLSNDESSTEFEDLHTENFSPEVVKRIFPSRSDTFVLPRTIMTTSNGDDSTVDSLTPHSENPVETTFFYDPCDSSDNISKGSGDGKFVNAAHLFRNSPLPVSPVTTSDDKFINSINTFHGKFHNRLMENNLSKSMNSPRDLLSPLADDKTSLTKVSMNDMQNSEEDFYRLEQEYVDDIKDLVIHRTTNWLKVLLLIIVLSSATAMLSLIQIGLTAPLQPGDVIYPGEQISRCGLLDILPSSLNKCEYALLAYNKDGRSLVLYNKGEVVWKMQTNENNYQVKDLHPKLQFLENKTILIGGNIAILVSHMLSEDASDACDGQVFIKKSHIAPWPFTEEPQKFVDLRLK